MARDSISQGSTYEEWIENIDVTDAVQAISKFAEYAPYIEYVVRAYRWYQTQRAKIFIKAISDNVGDLPAAKKQAFERVIKSNEGGELLAQFTDTIIRTSSRTAIVALAILYTDTDSELYSNTFKLAAALALEGISENEIDVFIELSQVKDVVSSEAEPNPPYPVVVVSDDLVEGLLTSRHLLEPPDMRVALVSSLIRRGLLLPDYATARTSKDAGVGITYGISASTRRFRHLLLRARSLLPDTDKQ